MASKGEQSSSSDDFGVEMKVLNRPQPSAQAPNQPSSSSPPPYQFQLPPNHGSVPCPTCGVCLVFPHGCSHVQCPQCHSTSKLQLVNPSQPQPPRLQMLCFRCHALLNYYEKKMSTLLQCPRCQAVMHPPASSPSPASTPPAPPTTGSRLPSSDPSSHHNVNQSQATSAAVPASMTTASYTDSASSSTPAPPKASSQTEAKRIASTATSSPIPTSTSINRDGTTPSLESQQAANADVEAEDVDEGTGLVSGNKKKTTKRSGSEYAQL